MKNTYLNTINKKDRLSSEEEFTLFQRYREDNDNKSFNRLIECNLVNTFNIAYSFYCRNNTINIDELVGEANEVLINCVISFDYTRGFRFYTYLKIGIINALVNLQNEYRNIRLPMHKYSLYGKIESNELEMFTDDELRSYELYSNYSYVRLDKTEYDDYNVNKDSGFDIEDAYFKKAMVQQEMVEDINLMLETLNPDELFIINSFFGLGLHKKLILKDIASTLGFSKGKVHSIKKDVLERFKTLNIK